MIFKNILINIRLTLVLSTSPSQSVCVTCTSFDNTLVNTNTAEETVHPHLEPTTKFIDDNRNFELWTGLKHLIKLSMSYLSVVTILTENILKIWTIFVDKFWTWHVLKRIVTTITLLFKICIKDDLSRSYREIFIKRL